MSRYIEADKVLKELRLNHKDVIYIDKKDTARRIEKIQGIDIVRCKECKWADWYKTADGKQFCYCMETGNGGRTADDYCSYGEREGK